MCQSASRTVREGRKKEALVESKDNSRSMLPFSPNERLIAIACVLPLLPKSVLSTIFVNRGYTGEWGEEQAMSVRSEATGWGHC